MPGTTTRANFRHPTAAVRAGGAPLFLLLPLLVMRAAAAAEAATGVADGPLDEDQLMRIGQHHDSRAHGAGNVAFVSWLTVCADLDRGAALHAACAAALRRLEPQPSVLISGFPIAALDIPAANDPWLVAVGSAVPPVVARTVLATARQVHAGPLLVESGNDESWIISVGPVVERAPDPAGAPAATPMAVLDRLCDPQLDDAGFVRAMSALQPRRPATAPPATAQPVGAVLVDLDLRAADGKAPAAAAALRTAGTTWTADGLFLPGHRLPPFHEHQVDLPVPQPPYVAELDLPVGAGGALTITLVVCPSSSSPGQDNLFNVGRRTRWFSAQVGADGGLIAGLDERWRLVPLRGAADDTPVRVTTRHWHALTVAVDGRLLRAVVDGRPAKDAQAPDDGQRIGPRAGPEAGAGVLSFVDPGTTRHLHGLLARVLVQRGMLDGDAILAVHRRLAVETMPPPTTPLAAQGVQGTVLPDPDQAKPDNVNDF